jgi:hypothetical protein
MWARTSRRSDIPRGLTLACVVGAVETMAGGGSGASTGSRFHDGSRKWRPGSTPTTDFKPAKRLDSSMSCCPVWS